MKILVACEYSGIVRDAFLKQGHEAYSCDIINNPHSNHLHCQVQEVLGCGWDMMIAHPPCDHLAVSGARWWPDKQKDGRQQSAIEFFLLLAKQPIERICIENPVGIMSSKFRKPDQYVHPWMFGDPFSKKTGLWLKNLPPLEPDNIVDKGEYVIHGGKRIPRWYSNRERNRDMTFPGIARAMAEQWG
jgi:hypothetical protein